jgi:hypothetical protein
MCVAAVLHLHAGVHHQGGVCIEAVDLICSCDDSQVFEDQLRGIVCYRDENGEMICEGYDEGPRLGMRLPEKAAFPW